MTKIIFNQFTFFNPWLSKIMAKHFSPLNSIELSMKNIRSCFFPGLSLFDVTHLRHVTFILECVNIKCCFFPFRLRDRLPRRIRRSVVVRRDANASRDARAKHDLLQPQRGFLRGLGRQEVRLSRTRLA